MSHRDAGAVIGICTGNHGEIHVSIPAPTRRRCRGIAVHRRAERLTDEVARIDGIPVTTPVLTLIDLATCVPRGSLEAAINEADKRDLLDPETLRGELDRFAGVPGVGVLREVLDRRTFRLTDSALERRFLRLVADAGLPPPQTGVWLNGFKVDFFWPELGLVVETDGLRYHRTPSEQARDALRDQAHTAAGLTRLRVTHSQVYYDPGYVQATLRTTAGNLTRL